MTVPERFKVIAMHNKHFEKYRQLGLNIAYYRKFNNLSQLQLAEQLGISRTHMSRIETVGCAVSLDVVFDICDVFHITPQQLFETR